MIAPALAVKKKKWQVKGKVSKGYEEVKDRP